jgi:hypothetical protein
VRSRIEFREEPDTEGPRHGESFEFLFVDSGHDREQVTRAFTTWVCGLAPGATVVFHDYDHPNYPGVREAIDELGLVGTQQGGMYVWCRADASAFGDAR